MYVVYTTSLCYSNGTRILFFLPYSLLVCCTDGFGEKGKPATGNEGAVPPNATLQITLELVSWKTVSEVTDDKKVIKKILKEGEGYERPNEGAVVKCKLINVLLDVHFTCNACLQSF